MPEIKVEDAKKELEGIVNKEKSVIEKSKEAQMSTEEKQKLEADKKEAEAKRIEAETQAKKDAELLVKKDEDIKDEADKKRKVELLEKQRKDEEAKLSTDVKIQRVKDETQKRIDEIDNKYKQLVDKTSKEAQSMRQELEIARQEKAALEKKISAPLKDDIVSLVNKEEKEKQTKYLQEDTSLPREDRREMPKDELEEWMLEDQTEAVAWINRREIRRAQEKYRNLSEKQLEGKTKTLVEKQIQSFKRVLIEHPELDISKRKDELKAQGKDEAEIDTILLQENPKYKLSIEIANDHPEWRTREDAPELLAAEMKKRLGASTGNDDGDKEKEELKSQVEALTARLDALENPPDEGITSTVRRKARETQASEGEKELIRTMQEVKAPQDMIDRAVKKYREKQQKE